MTIEQLLSNPDTILEWQEPGLFGPMAVRCTVGTILVNEIRSHYQESDANVLLRFIQSHDAKPV